MIFVIILRRYVIFAQICNYFAQICDYFAHICNFDLRKNVIDSLRRYVKRGLFCEHFNLVFLTECLFGLRYFCKNYVDLPVLSQSNKITFIFFSFSKCH